MTDEEVRSWLSDEERRMLAQTNKPYVLSLARSLAETRRALAACEWADGAMNYPRCPLCAAEGNRTDEPPEPHDPACFFATMPRPR